MTEVSLHGMRNTKAVIVSLPPHIISEYDK
jgi:hypothetical protein